MVHCHVDGRLSMLEIVICLKTILKLIIFVGYCNVDMDLSMVVII